MQAIFTNWKRKASNICHMTAIKKKHYILMTKTMFSEAADNQ
jgi:hypothetical protein